MRTLTDHKLSDLNASIAINVVDPPGSGGASHVYEILLYGTPTEAVPSGPVIQHTDIRFQNGAVKEVGLNGISDEALLAVVIDRLRCFQNGSFKCRENAVALTKLETSLLWLQKRTRDRIARGVEGLAKA